MCVFVVGCQVNLVASGASESEIFIWDLNSPEKPMTPGAKAQVCTTSVVTVAFSVTSDY